MSSIQVVLLKTMPGVGQQGEIIQVKFGYAQNFLIPQKTAAPFGSPEAKKIILEINARKEEKTKQKKIKEQKKVEKEIKQKQTKARQEKLLIKPKK